MELKATGFNYLQQLHWLISTVPAAPPKRNRGSAVSGLNRLPTFRPPNDHDHNDHIARVVFGLFGH